MPIKPIPFQNHYAKLPEAFYQKNRPTPPPSPKMKVWNEDLAQFLGIDPNTSRYELEEIFSGSKIAINSEPLSMAYSGHQFGHFNPNLGDGRAHLLGELLGEDSSLYEIQLKGSGRSKFSRRGDGLSPLGPVVREYIVSEAMHFLGVPTTRSLAVVETGQQVERETSLGGGVLTRVAESHIRVGHFEYFADRKDIENLKVLIQFLIERSYPNLIESEDKPLKLFAAIVKKQALLVAQWMSFGFVHGVMNTDNTSASGIIIDFGPCAFLDETDFDKVFSSIDRHGRYAYGRQPAILQWNLARLAETLIATYPEAEQNQKVKDFEKELYDFSEIFSEHWRSLFNKKIGFNQVLSGKDAKIQERWLEYFNSEKIDFTQGFRGLSELLNSEVPSSVYTMNQKLKDLIQDWKNLILTHSNLEDAMKLMDSVNPIIIPRNHVVERIIQSCYQGDYIEFKTFVHQLKTPYIYSEAKVAFMTAPTQSERITKTFCGT